tara:strand:- start:4355 stop:5125 length:771 start_codon:yes stop_codon:yes gene_type:complete
MKSLNWYFSKCWLWSNSLLHSDKEDLLLVSFPKTGSTWIRYFLYSLLTQKIENAKQNIDAMNEAMPEFANASFFNPWRFNECPRIVKTHQKYILPFQLNRSVLIVRDPRDIVISYYYYLIGLKVGNFQGSVSEILRNRQFGAEAFFKHFCSWQDHVGLTIRYEDLKDEPYDGFSKLIQFFGIKRSEQEICSAIEDAKFSSMLKAQDKSSKLKTEFRKGHHFVRSGKKEQWRDLFSSQDIEYYEALKVKYSFDLYES